MTSAVRPGLPRNACGVTHSRPVSFRICRQRPSTLLTCCQVPFRVGKTASTSASCRVPRRPRSTVTANSGSDDPRICPRLAVSPLAGVGLERRVDREGSLIKVDVAPPEGEHFDDAGAGGEHQVDDVGHVARRLRAGPVPWSSRSPPQPERSPARMRHAEQRGLPVSTVVPALVLQAITPVDELKSALDKLETDLAAVRRKALSA
jgi:hypothetical protein